MGAVVDPLTRGHDPFAGGNDSSMTHHGHDVTMAARPRAQNAETILCVVVDHSLNESGADSCGSLHFQLVKVRQRLPFEAGGRAFALREQLTAACNQATTPAKNSRKHLDFDWQRS